MTDGRLPRAFWCTLDALDYWLTLAWLRIRDALAGPEPEVPADQKRQREQEQIERAFPKPDDQEQRAAIPHRRKTRRAWPRVSL